MMRVLLDVLAGLGLATAAPANGNDRVSEPPDLVFGRGEAEIKLKTELFQRIFHGEPFEWSADLERGTISFTSASTVVRAPVQVIGTLNTRDGTFLWGWDHPSVPEPQAASARLARQFGEKHKLPLFTTRKVDVTEEQAWRFTAAALYLSNAQGAYRGPSGTTMVFMTFGTLTISRR